MPKEFALLAKFVGFYIQNERYLWGTIDFHPDLSHMPSLKEVVFEKFSVSPSSADAFFSIGTLETVVMNGIPLGALPDVKAMHALRVIQLIDNSLESSAPSFANLANLESLKISGEP